MYGSVEMYGAVLRLDAKVVARASSRVGTEREWHRQRALGIFASRWPDVITMAFATRGRTLATGIRIN